MADLSPSRAPQSTGTGLAPNVAGALAYLLGPVTGILFLLMEKEDRFVRFHAAQSVVVGAALIVLAIALQVVGAILGVVPVLGWMVGVLLSLAFGLASLALWIVLMVRAYQGAEWHVPVVADYTDRLVHAQAPH